MHNAFEQSINKHIRKESRYIYTISRCVLENLINVHARYYVRTSSSCRSEKREEEREKERECEGGHADALVLREAEQSKR